MIAREGGAAPPRSALAARLPPLLAFAGLWVILFLVFPPARQDFPLNDDWIFTRVAIALARGDPLDDLRSSAIPAIGQCVWAIPFSSLLGERPVAFRFSTIVLSLVGIAAFQDLLLRGGVAPLHSAVAASALGLHPIFFLLAGSFMTDVPALAFSLVALAAYARLAVAPSLGWRAIAFGASALACSTRQGGIAAPLAGFLVLAWAGRRREAAWAALAALVAPVAYVWLHTQYPAGVEGRPPTTAPSPFRLFLFSFYALHMTGLASLPLLLLSSRPASLRRTLTAAFVAIAMALSALLLYRAPGLLWPYLGPYITPWGTYFENRNVLGDRPIVLGWHMRMIVAGIGCAAAGWLVGNARIVREAGPGVRLLLLFAAFYAGLLSLVVIPYDRYFLPLLPPALGLVAVGPVAGPRRWLAGAALVLYAAFSIALAHDLLSWNAARWAVGRRALERGVPADEIHGGVEWVGWFHGRPPEAAEPPPQMETFRFPFAPIRSRYILSFSVPRGAEVVDSEPYRLLLAPGPRAFYMIRNPERDERPLDEPAGEGRE